MKDGQPYSEFTQYPEITGPEEEMLQTLGLALFGVQGTEAKLRFLLSFVLRSTARPSPALIVRRSGTRTMTSLLGAVQILANPKVQPLVASQAWPAEGRGGGSSGSVRGTCGPNSACEGPTRGFVSTTPTRGIRDQ
jgi:hypothetical protein